MQTSYSVTTSAPPREASHPTIHWLLSEAAQEAMEHDGVLGDTLVMLVET